MLDGRFWRLTIASLVLLAPAVLASPPAPNQSEGPEGTGGQDITDMAMDPTGQFVAAVVTVDPAAGILPPLPGAPVHKDIYACDFADPKTRNAGPGCRGIDHQANFGSTQTGATQVVAYTSFQGPGGLQPRFAVGGPSDTVSFWDAFSDIPRWEWNVSTGNVVVNITLSPDASRIVAGVAPPGPTGSGRILVFDTARMGPSDRSPLWVWTLEGARPTSMAHARAANTAIVGTSNQILFLPTSVARQPSVADVHPIDTTAAVRDVAIASDASAAAAATATHVWYVTKPTTNTERQQWARSIDGGAQRVALSLDGQRFAAAAGSKIYFYRSNPSVVAEAVGDPFDTGGAAVSDLAYDAKGGLLVAIAGNRVYAFAPSENKPIWTFDATDANRGGLDGPLRRVVVSDNADRIVVAGKTKVMPYRSLVSASAAFNQGPAIEVRPGTTTKFSFTVTNTGSLPDNYTFVTRFPPGWNGFGPDPVTLLPDRSTTLNVSLDIPAGIEPGIRGFDVQVRSQILVDTASSNPAVAGPAFNFTIPRYIELNVTTADDRVPPLRQGGEQVVPVTVRNRGNAEGVVNMSVTQKLARGSSWNIRFSEDQLRIAAGAEKTINLVVTAPQDSPSGERNDITIVAREGPLNSIKAEATRALVAYVDPKFGAELSAQNASYEFGPGEIQNIPITLLNSGNTDDVYNITTTITPATHQNDWRVVVSDNVSEVLRGQSKTIQVSIRPQVSDPREASLVIRAISKGSGESETATLTLSLAPRPPTPSPTNPLPAAPLALVVPLLVAAALALRRRSGGKPE